MWAHHPAALCSWTVMDSMEGALCYYISLSLFSLSYRGTFWFSPSASQNQRSLHQMCAPCVGAQWCWHAVAALKVFVWMLDEKASQQFPTWCFETLQSNILHINEVNPMVFALCQRMTCFWIHIWTGAYMLNSVFEIILCFLFLGDNIPGCCYCQRYKNRKICKTSQSEYSIII